VSAASAVVATPLYEAEFAGDGTVTRWVLAFRGRKPIAVRAVLPPLAVAVQGAGRASELLDLRPETARVVVDRERPVGRLGFTGMTTDGLVVRRVMEFRADSYRVGSTISVGGAAKGPLDIVMYWTTPTAEPPEGKETGWHTFGETPRREHLLGRILVGRLAENPEVYEAPPPALRDPKESPRGPELKDPREVPSGLVEASSRWAALEDDYFIAALIPHEGARLTRARTRDVAEVGLVFAGVRPAGAQPWQGSADLYVGPKQWDRLKALGVGLEAAQGRNYGYFLWFSSWGTPPFPVPWVPMAWFCVPLLWLLNLFGSRLPGANYGLAIILLTVLVKLVFYPLSLKSMRSMKQMQALQPQLNALRAKYRSDPQRFQREQMALFRKYRVNPMGGCLPMVVQIPIFYALYLTLQYSVELQGAPFVLWITDLSRKDPYYVLPILMGISMLVQQKMTPTTGDPRQAQIMLVMPVIFTFMFLEFPTGLVLYWLVNNLLSIAQQYLIDRSFARTKAGVEQEARQV
jgi:YidC/Oxa1 family membrane protein insertase